MAIALEELERYVNKLRRLVEGGSGGTPSEPTPPADTTVNWSDIVGVPATFPPEPHIHPEVLGVIQHGGNALAERSDYDVVLWIGTVQPLHESAGGHAKNEDLLLLLSA